jgi:amino-acid N-acetyltransferase
MTPTQIVIRQATDKDKKEIKKLVSLYPKFLMKEIPKIKSFFVAQENGKIVGCCALDIYSKRIAEIRSLAVLKNYQGKGVGTKLVDTCLKKAKNKKIYEVLTITSKEKFFDGLGFKPFHNEHCALFKIM